MKTSSIDSFGSYLSGHIPYFIPTIVNNLELKVDGNSLLLYSPHTKSTCYLNRLAKEQLFTMFGLPHSYIDTPRGNSSLLDAVEHSKYKSIYILYAISKIYSIFAGDWGILSSNWYLEPKFCEIILSYRMNADSGDIWFYYPNHLFIKQNIFRKFRPYAVHLGNKKHLNIANDKLYSASCLRLINEAEISF